LKPKIDFNELEVRKLSEECNVSSFCCGYDAVDEFLQKEAMSFQNEKLGTTYLWYHRERLIGFATLIMSQLKKNEMHKETRLEVGKEFYPAILIGQLGVQKEFQKLGIGSMICGWCLGKAHELSEQLGCRFLIVNAVENKIDWYKRRGFQLLPKQGNRREKVMFLDIAPRFKREE
jgi:GNAT superfamily N-acetyltransferase